MSNIHPPADNRVLEHKTAKAQRTTAVLGTVTALLTAIVLVVGLLAHNQTQQKDQAQTKVEDLSGSVETLQSQVASLKKVNTDLVAQNQDLQSQVQRLKDLQPSVSPSQPESSSPATLGLHLADRSTLPEGALVDQIMDTQTNIGINGRTFDFGWTRYGGAGNAPAILVGINLNKGFTSFSGRIGVLSSSPNTSGKLEIIADGKVLFSKNVSLQRSYDVLFPVKGIERLEIKAYPSQGESIIYAIGDPTVTP